MDKERKFEGKWFLRDRPKETYSGTLHYSRTEGCYIDIIGMFEGSIFDVSTFDVICGITSIGKKVTLIKCFSTSRTQNSNGIIISKYIINYCFIGEHYQNLQELNFDKVSASISDLDIWVGVYGTKELQIDFLAKGVNIKYELPKEIRLEITNKGTITFDFEYSPPLKKQTSNIEIVQSTTVSLALPFIKNYHEVLQHFFTFYKFLAFTYFDTPHILTVFLENSTTNSLSNAGSPTIEILYSDHYYQHSYKNGKTSFLFKYLEVEEKFPALINKWFALFEKISPTVNLLNELLLKRKVPLEIKFLSAIQAVESFHRNIFGGEILPKDEHKERVRYILESVPLYRDWLRQELAFSNQPKLRDRLRDLYARIPVAVTTQLIKDEDEFISGVISSRNYYTHYGSVKKSKIMNSDDIYKAIEKLKIFLICLILNELGFSEDEIIKFATVEKLYPYLD